MKSEKLEFEVGGLKLRGQKFSPAVPKPLAVLFLHGWTGKTNTDAADMLAENGYYAMTFSLSGHNDSDGQIEDQTRDKSLNEVLAAYDLFKSKLPNGTEIGVAGNSYGGYMAALLSEKRLLAFIQLRVPANYPDEHSDQPQVGQGGDDDAVMTWREKSLTKTGTRALSAIASFEGPIQIIEAEHDERVPHQTVQNFVHAIKDKSRLDYHLMKGWPHSLGDDQQRNHAYQQILLNWLNEQV